MKDLSENSSTWSNYAIKKNYHCLLYNCHKVRFLKSTSRSVLFERELAVFLFTNYSSSFTYGPPSLLRKPRVDIFKGAFVVKLKGSRSELSPCTLMKR